MSSKFFLDLFGSTQLCASDFNFQGHTGLTFRIPWKSPLSYSGIALRVLCGHFEGTLAFTLGYSGVNLKVLERSLLGYYWATLGVPWRSDWGYVGSILWVILGVPLGLNW